MLGSGWGKGGWDLGSSAGHGFGGGLFSFATLGGLQARCSWWKVGQPMGLFQVPVSWGTQPPQSPWALPVQGGQPRTEQGMAGKSVRAAVRRAKSAPQDRAWLPTPSGRANDGGGCGVVEDGRAGRARGTCTNPRVCVRACVGLVPPDAPPYPGEAREERRSPGARGGAFPRLAPPPALGYGAPLRAGRESGLSGAPVGPPRAWRVSATGARIPRATR